VRKPEKEETPGVVEGKGTSAKKSVEEADVDLMRKSLRKTKRKPRQGHVYRQGKRGQRSGPGQTVQG